MADGESAMKAARHLSILLAAVLFFPVAGNTGTITTPGIVAKTTTAALSCMRWMPIGMCFWLRCSWSGCSVRTSIKVGHYNPDLVVSAYNELGGNPWAEIRATLGLAQKAAATGLLGALLPVPIDSAGNRTEGTADNRDHKNLVYRETDAIGHPLSSLSGLVAGVGLLCPSQTTSFFPYFQSGLDALSWRQEVPEIFYPASFIPGLREIGTWPLQTWGGVYPRTGWTTQAEEPKAAAINAQRAGDIVTRAAQPHVYVPITGSSFSDQKVWPPGPLVEKDRRTGTWQMLVPRSESSCNVFGTNVLASLTGWGCGRVDSAGDYVWNLWRPYKCCRRRGQWFLFSIDWMAYPPWINDLHTLSP
ncbi:MAG: TIGR03756 family integrating conjugative element protein, partial [Gammaproteobacteria bacterium]|nr:TIGR03756 family integrating conjugative element protein [Gammaproteobacteria bacterium]